MASFDLEENFDIDPWEYYSKCSKIEKEELIDLLEEDDLVVRNHAPSTTNPSVIQIEFFNSLKKIESSYFVLSQDDLDLISQIAKKY